MGVLGRLSLAAAHLFAHYTVLMLVGPDRLYSLLDEDLLTQLRTWWQHPVVMAVKPVRVSIDTRLLERIDRDPETRERGRSAFLRSAAELYLAAKKRRRIDLEIRKAYEGEADDMLLEIESLMKVHAWPEP